MQQSSTHLIIICGRLTGCVARSRVCVSCGGSLQGPSERLVLRHKRALRSLCPGCGDRGKSDEFHVRRLGASRCLRLSSCVRVSVWVVGMHEPSISVKAYGHLNPRGGTGSHAVEAWCWTHAEIQRLAWLEGCPYSPSSARGGCPCSNGSIAVARGSALCSEKKKVSATDAPCVGSPTCDAPGACTL